MSTGWSRPRGKPTGRPALLFYFIPGEPPAGGLALSRSRHHVEGFPAELRVSAHERAAGPEWFARFFARPGLGFGIDEAFGAASGAVRAAGRGTVVRGEFPDPATLDYLRDSAGVVSAVVEQGGLGVLDLYAARWWSAARWVERFVDRCEFEVRDHVEVVVSDDDRHHPGVWVHTRGLRKFGRPDLQVRHVPGPWSDENPRVKAAGHLLTNLAEYLARGAVIRDRQTMTFPDAAGPCTFLASPDDLDSEACHFGNEALEVVDLVDGRPSSDLNRLLEGAAAKGG
jgi:hypothetical protein